MGSAHVAAPVLERSPVLTGEPPAAMSQCKAAQKTGKAVAAVQVGQQFTTSGGFCEKHCVSEPLNFDFGERSVHYVARLS